VIKPLKLFCTPSKKYDRMIGFLSPQILPYLPNKVQSLDFKNRSSDHDFLGYTYFIFRPAAYYFSILASWITLAIHVSLRISSICQIIENGGLTGTSTLVPLSILGVPFREPSQYKLQSEVIQAK
jgi:hypothetical protein